MRSIFLFIMAFVAIWAHSYAQIDISALSPDSALTQALARIEGQPISLDDVVSSALEHSTMARDAEAALVSARGYLNRESGVFDPELFGELSRESAKQPSASPFAGAAVLNPERTAGQLGARVTLPIGTELEASVIGSKVETNSAFSSLNPEYTAVGNLTFKQPLLKGFGPSAWANRAQALKAYDAAKLRYEQTLAAVRAFAEQYYWELYAAERDLAVSLVTRDLALALLQEADLRAETGLVGPNQVNNAKVFLADQELNLLDARDYATRASDALASLIGTRPLNADRYRTIDSPPQVTETESADAVVARAFENNKLLKAARLDVEGTEALARAASWDALPGLDLFGALGGNGLAGTGQDVIFGTDTLRNNLDTKFADALDQALNRDYPSWMIGLRLNVPILQRGPMGERSRLRAEVNRAEQRYIQYQRSLEEQVRATHRELEQGKERLQLSEENVRASLDQVRIGLIEYRGGKSTAFELVRLGADLANAQRRYSRTLVRTAKAAAELRVLAPANE